MADPVTPTAPIADRATELVVNSTSGRGRAVVEPAEFEDESHELVYEVTDLSGRPVPLTAALYAETPFEPVDMSKPAPSARHTDMRFETAAPAEMETEEMEIELTGTVTPTDTADVPDAPVVTQVATPDLGPVFEPVAGTDVATGGERSARTPGALFTALPEEPVWSYTGAAAKAAPPASVPQGPAFGPMGSRRSPIAVVLLSIITLGIYNLWLHARWNSEMSDFDPRLTVHPRTSAWAVTLPWLAGVAASAVGGAVLVVHAANLALPFHNPITVHMALVMLAGIVVIPYAVLLVPFSCVAMVMTAERVRIVQDRVGTPTDHQVRPVRSVCWLLLPVLGGLVLVGMLQSSLNTAWERVAPPASYHGH